MKKKGKINEYNILGLNIQIILTILVCIFSLLGFLVNKNFFNIMKIFGGLDLLVMAYNNEKIYHNKGISVVYVIFGVIMLIWGIVGLVGVI